MILRAYREVVAEEPDGPVLLSDVVFRTPFFDQASRTLRITFRPAVDGDGRDVLVESRRVDADGAWTGHVSCHVGPAADERAGPVDLAALRLRFDVAGELERPTGRGKLFTLGPRWRNITSVRASGEEKLLRVELPAAFRAEIADHVLHPALLDTVAAAVRGPGQASSVPFHYGRVVVHAPLPATFHAHVRRAADPEPTVISGDIDLLGDDGALLVRIERFTMLMVDEQRLRDSAATAATPPAPPAGPAVEEPTPDGSSSLDPTTAIELMLGMLDAGLAGPVHVAHGGRQAIVTNRAPVAAGAAAPGVVAAAPVPATAPAPATAAPVPAGGSPDAAGGDSPAAQLRRIWMESLGIAELDENEDFFDAGGNSLTALELAARIRAALGIELRIGVLLEARTFAELVQVLTPEARP
jgi:acyl carrier protein